MLLRGRGSRVSAAAPATSSRLKVRPGRAGLGDGEREDGGRRSRLGGQPDAGPVVGPATRAGAVAIPFASVRNVAVVPVPKEADPCVTVELTSVDGAQALVLSVSWAASGVPNV